jgi:hypothetical protein
VRVNKGRLASQLRYFAHERTRPCVTISGPCPDEACWLTSTLPDNALFDVDKGHVCNADARDRDAFELFPGVAVASHHEIAA